MQAPAPQLPANGFQLQRKCACGSYGGGGECDKCREDKTKLQRAAAGAGKPNDLPPLVYDVLRSSGEPLDARMRGWMEPRFNHDFSGVRVHTDARAAQSAREVHALAYTVGQDVVFGAGQYAPGTERGGRLLAHELTHVVQQTTSGGSAQAKAVSDPSDAAEIEADATANRVMSGEPARVTQAPSATLHALSPGETAGLIGGIVGGIGTGLIIAWAAGAFDKERFSPTELTEYLTTLATTRRIARGTDADNKARDVVRHWRAGEAAFNIDNGFSTRGGSLTAVELKRLLIKQMLDGVTTGSDEEAILTILGNTPADDVVQILDPNHGISVQQLDDKIGGDNHTRLEAILERLFPSSSTVRRDTAPSCTARQGLMIEFARRQALEMVNNAIDVITKRRDDPNFQRALECRFRGADIATQRQIVGIFQGARDALATRLYHCAAEGGAAELEAPPRITATTGEALPPVRCDQEDANSFRTDQGRAFREVYLCGAFFRRSPELQAITVVHEAVHAAGLGRDTVYQPGCGEPLQTALANPDFFAFFANDLMQPLEGTRTPDQSTSEPRMPTVSVGNFRNTGAISPENHCPVCPDLPGLGLDTNTFLNIMELRGDVTGHRSEIEYDFKRTKEHAIWKHNTNAGWQMLRYLPPGTEDDRTERDEDVTVRNNHIYSIDGPGLQDLFDPIPDSGTADEAVYKASFIESVNARIRPGPWVPVSNEFHWHSVTWIEKVRGSWQRVDGSNEIEPGGIIIGTGLPYGPGDYPMPNWQGGVPV
jgi:hypothetical protein